MHTIESSGHDTAPSLLSLACAALSCLAPGCSDEATSIKVRLAVDPQLNSERQLLSVVDAVELILDSPTGFAGVQRAGDSHGSLTAVNADTDAALELRLRRGIDGSLPRFRLLPGSNADRSFKITARGLRGETVAALGGLDTVQFTDSEALDLLVPFNLRAAHRPPRVLVTLPHDGESSVPVKLNQVFVEFSRRVTQESLTRGLRVIYEGSTGDVRVPGMLDMTVKSVVDSGMQEQRSAATFQFECPLNPGTYRIEAGVEIQDDAGVGLDQDAVKQGADPFVSRFTIAGTRGTDPCATKLPPEGCRRPEDCDPELTGAYTCILDPGAEVGFCAPSMDDCASLRCPEHYVCDPGLPASNCPLLCDQACMDSLLQQGVDKREAEQKCCKPDPSCSPLDGSSRPSCVQDCRWGGVCYDWSYCDQVTGLCRPCDQQANDPACLGPGDNSDKCLELCREACANDQQSEQCLGCYQDSGCQ